MFVRKGNQYCTITLIFKIMVLSRQFAAILFVWPLFGEVIYAQSHTLKGSVVDELRRPVTAVSCVLRSSTDSLFVQSTLSDENGDFIFADIGNGAYTLYLNHMSYKLQTISVEINNQDQIFEQPYTLQQQENLIDEVVVTAERPTVKLVDQKLVYDVTVLKDNKIISNAFDLLRHIPNLVGSGDDLKLVGSSNYAILIDGKPSSLTKGQMIQTLKTMSASRVADVEIMYSAPPQYNVQGAAINIVLKNDAQSPETPPLQGEVAAEYTQGHYPGYGIRANLFYNKSSYKVDLTVGAKTSKEWNRNKMDAVHQLQENRYDISLDDERIYKFSDLDLRLNVLRTLSRGSTLSLTYTGNLNRRTGYQASNSVFIENSDLYEHVKSRVDKEIDTDFHNIRFDYSSSKRLSLGVEYTLFHDPTKELYKEFDTEYQNIVTEYRTKTKQNINKILVYLNHELSLGKDWKLNYGIKASYSANRNNYDYFKVVSATSPDSISHIKQQEDSYSAYVGFSKKINDKLSAQASLSGGFYRGTIDYGDREQTLWSDFQLFVNANLAYVPSPKHTLQLSFSSEIQYPPYWALSNNGFRLNTYTILLGNPSLKFARKYNAQLVYVINQKYTLMAYNSYVPNYFTQVPYQSQDALQNIIQMVNLDYQNIYGIVGIVPFRVKKFLESQLTVNFFRQTDKDNDFHGLRFRNSHNSFIIQLDNTFNISSKPDIKGELSGYYISGGIQGIYDIEHFYSIAAGIKWQTNNKRIEVGAKVDDIFQTTNVSLRTNYQNQNIKMRDYADTPFFRFNVSYRFGNYSGKEKSTVDKSRFGR